MSRSCRNSAGTASARLTSHACTPPRYSASSANPTGTLPPASSSSVSGDTDKYDGPPSKPGCIRTRSLIHAPTAAENPACNPAVNGISFRAPLDPLVGARCVTRSVPSTFISPPRARSTHGANSSHPRNGTRRANSV